MRYATLSTIQFTANAMPFLVALVTLALSAYGVHLYVNRATEVMYLETGSSYDHRALKIALGIIDRMGLEPLSEDECMPEQSPRGGVRIYLAERAPA